MSSASLGAEIERTYGVTRNAAGPLVAVGLLAIVALVAYFDTLAGMVQIWARSGTYMHGFVMPVLAGWLAWHQRARLRGVPSQPSIVGLLTLAAAVLLWLLGWSASAAVVQQFAFIGLITTIIFTVFGYEILRRLAGPIVLLLFAVPFGEFLMQPMMELTATAAVAGLQASGITVVRDGLYFSTSSGDFEVARACSGMRYLIASMALGTFYALLSLRTTRSRLLFLAVCAAVPIVANLIRAYLIVLVAHLSSLRFATGVDHIIYGWLLFGVVAFIILWIGERMRAREGPGSETSAIETSSPANSRLLPLVCVTIAAIAVLLSGPFLAQRIRASELETVQAAVSLPQLTGSWTGPARSDPGWLPRFAGEPQRILGRYASATRAVDVAVVWYARQEQGNELVMYGNDRWTGGAWHKAGVTHQRAALGEHSTVAFSSTRIVANDGSRVRTVWQTYAFGTQFTTGAYVGKFLEAVHRLVHPRQPAFEILLSTDAEEGDAVLKGFADAQLATIGSTMQADPAKGSAP